MILRNIPAQIFHRPFNEILCQSSKLVVNSPRWNRYNSFSSQSSTTVEKMTEDSPTQTISYVTISSEEMALKLARSLVKNRLAACVNVVEKVKSIYEWQGKIEQDSESMLIVKSDSSKTAELTRFVETNHPYDCPEVVTVKIDSGSRKYLDWITQTIHKPPPQQDQSGNE